MPGALTVVALWLAVHVTLAEAARLAPQHVGVAAEGRGACWGQFQACEDGSCALDESLCGLCEPGQLVCPISHSCVDGGAAAYDKCPGLKGSHLDASLPPETRATLLSKALSLDQLAAQLSNTAPALPDHGVPRFQWLADNLHGIRAVGPNAPVGGPRTIYPANGTCFPYGPALGATWNPALLQQIGYMVGTESRALYNLESLSGRRGWVPDPFGNPNVLIVNGAGISVYSPNVNLARDPRWGRVGEVYTEDAHLMTELADAFVAGPQTPDQKSGALLTSATCKHAAVYDVERNRHDYSAVVKGRALSEFYLPALEACSATGAQVMCSYNAINGKPACSEERMLDGVFRNSSGFGGFVVSDYDAWSDFQYTYGIAQSPEEAAAIGLKAGLDMEGGGDRIAKAIPSAVSQGLVSRDLAERAFKRVMEVRIRLGSLDPPSAIGYNSLGPDDVASEANLQAALTAARQGLVLLKNDNGVLPLKASAVTGRKILVSGFAGDDRSIVLGPYANGPAASQWYQDKYVVSMVQGIKDAAPEGTDVLFEPGCTSTQCNDQSGFRAAQQAAYAGPAAIVVMLNLDQGIENEGLDRWSIELPSGQKKLVEVLRDAVPDDTPVIAVLVHGGVVGLPPFWDSVDAVFDSFYPGIYGGQAVGEALFGTLCPSGKLPVTVYTSDDQLPASLAQQDPYPRATSAPYSMGLTYKYFTGRPFLPFGFGLSYTTFSYELKAPPAKSAPCDSFNVTFTVTNTGAVEGEEVAQVYLATPGATVPAPKLQLAAFQRVGPLAPGAAAEVSLLVKPSSHFVVYEVSGVPWNATRHVEEGVLLLWVGGGQPEHTAAPDASVTVTGSSPLAACKTKQGKSLHQSFT